MDITETKVWVTGLVLCMALFPTWTLIMRLVNVVRKTARDLFLPVTVAGPSVEPGTDARLLRLNHRKAILLMNQSPHSGTELNVDLSELPIENGNAVHVAGKVSKVSVEASNDTDPAYLVSVNLDTKEADQESLSTIISHLARNPVSTLDSIRAGT